jgi:hypothetical protein
MPSRVLLILLPASTVPARHVLLERQFQGRAVLVSTSLSFVSIIYQSEHLHSRFIYRYRPRLLSVSLTFAGANSGFPPGGRESRWLHL